MKSSILSCAIILTLLLGALNAVFADDVIWNFNPINGNWHVAENWTPEQVPRGSDTAHFALSKITGVSVERQTHIQEVVDQANFTVRASQSGDRPSGSLSFSDPAAGISIAKARIRTLTFNGNSADLGGIGRLGNGTRVT